MFERRRPVLGLILGLNVCVLIWRISVQEPAILDTEAPDAGAGLAGMTTAAASNANSRLPQLQQQFETSYYHYNSNNFNNKRQQFSNDFTYVAVRQPKHQQQHAQQHQQQLYAGKHLLSKRMEMNESAGSGVATDKTVTMKRKYLYKVATSLKQNKRSRIKNKINGTSTSSITNTNNNNGLNKYSNKNLALSSKLTATGIANSTTLTASAPLVTEVTATLGENRRAGDAASAAVVGAASIGTFNTSTSLAEYLPEHDTSQLIDLHNFVFLMPQQACSSNIQVLILVHSAPANSKKRKVIRETWGSLANGVSTTVSSQLHVIFLLGAVESPKVQLELQEENTHYGDMVQGSFQDNYRNMTYKHVMALKWFIYNCAHAQILIKVDDDVFVNTPQLLKYLKMNLSTNTSTNKTAANSVVNAASQQFSASQGLFQHPQNLIFCDVCIGSYVKRTYRSKWRVSVQEYAERFYPPYCPGYAIMYSSDVVLRLYEAAQKHKYFWIDDVHITGVLAQHINVSITTSASYILRQSQCEDLLSGKTNLNEVEFLYAWHSISPKQIRELWRLHLENAKNTSNYSASSSSSLVNNKNYSDASKSYTYDDIFR